MNSYEVVGGCPVNQLRPRAWSRLHSEGRTAGLTQEARYVTAACDREGHRDSEYDQPSRTRTVEAGGKSPPGAAPVKARSEE